MLEGVSYFWDQIQGYLFPLVEEELGPLNQKQQQLIEILEVIQIERFIPDYRGYVGRPKENRVAIVRAFVAKAVYNMTTTRALLDRLETDVRLRRICGWERASQVPSESTFSRAFAEFATSELPQKVHDTLIKKTYRGNVVGHVSNDSTPIEAREKPVKKEKNNPKSSLKNQVDQKRVKNVPLKNLSV